MLITGFVTAELNVIVIVPTSVVFVVENVDITDAAPAAPLSNVVAVIPPATVFKLSFAVPVQVAEPPFVNVTVVVMPSVVFCQSLATVAPLAVQVPVLVLARMPA